MSPWVTPVCVGVWTSKAAFAWVYGDPTEGTELCMAGVPAAQNQGPQGNPPGFPGASLSDWKQQPHGLSRPRDSLWEEGKSML